MVELPRPELRVSGFAVSQGRGEQSGIGNTVQRQAKRLLRLVVGGLLILLGIIGGFIPILQGWVFIILGLSVIAPESERARQWLAWAKSKVGSKQELPEEVD